jgi:hypothetical protein
MGRPPLPPATAGKIRCNRSGKNWVARCEFRDHDGAIDQFNAHARPKRQPNKH